MKDIEDIIKTLQKSLKGHKALSKINKNEIKPYQQKIVAILKHKDENSGTLELKEIKNNSLLTREEHKKFIIILSKLKSGLNSGKFKNNADRKYIEKILDLYNNYKILETSLQNEKRIKKLNKKQKNTLKNTSQNTTSNTVNVLGKVSNVASAAFEAVNSLVPKPTGRQERVLKETFNLLENLQLETLILKKILQALV